MAEAEYLIGLSQIALGLTGFTGVVVAFGYSPSEWSRADRMRLFLLIVSSIAAIFLTLLPLVFNAFGMVPSRLWRVASLIHALSFLVITILYFTRFFRLKRQERRHISYPLTLFLTLGSFACILLQFLNALGVFGAVFGVFFLGLLWGLFVPAVQFGRMVYVHFVNPSPSIDNVALKMRIVRCCHRCRQFVYPARGCGAGAAYHAQMPTVRSLYFRR